MTIPSQDMYASSIPLRGGTDLCFFLSNMDIKERDRQARINEVRRNFEQEQNKWEEKKNDNERKFITAASNGVGAVFSFAATFLATRPEVAAAGALSVLAVLTHDLALTALGFFCFGVPVGVITAFAVHWVGHAIYDYSHPQIEQPQVLVTENADNLTELKNKVRTLKTRKLHLQTREAIHLEEISQLNLAIRKFENLIAQAEGNHQPSSQRASMSLADIPPPQRLRRSRSHETLVS